MCPNSADAGEPLLSHGSAGDEEKSFLWNPNFAGVNGDPEAPELPPHAAAGGASVAKTCLNLINAVSGIGVLSMPYAVARTGWLGLLLFFSAGAVCYYTGLLLRRCMLAVDDPAAGYPSIGERAFGPAGRTLVAAFTYAELYLVAVSFLILEGDNLAKLFPDAAIQVYPVVLRGKQLFILVAAAAVLPTTFINNLSAFAYVSAVGLVSTAALTVSLIIAAATGAARRSTTVLLNWEGIPASLGLFFACFAAHAVYPTIYSSMRDRRRFPTALLISSSACTANYAVVAVLGYFLYGEDAQSQVTLNLPSGSLYSKAAIVATVVNPLAKYALVVSPIVSAVAGRVRLGRGAASAGVVVSTAAVASVVPFFGEVMSLTGSLLCVMATVIFPCACYLKIYGKSATSSASAARWEMLGIAVIVAVGGLVAVTGTYCSVRQIISSFISDLDM